MRRKTQLAFATIAIAGLATMSGTWAAPGGNGKGGAKGNSGRTKTNHGTTVSSAARTKVEGTNHGKIVSATASSKNRSKNSKRIDGYYYDDADLDNNTKGSVRSSKVQAAARTRNEAIRAAQRTFYQQRAAILNDGDINDELTDEQRRQLREAERARNAAIRAAQEQYRIAVR